MLVYFKEYGLCNNDMYLIFVVNINKVYLVK